MKFEELSQADQELLNVEFSPEIEKLAAQNAADISELQEIGFVKMAAEAADEMDKEEEEEKKEEKKELDEEHKKEASVKGAILADSYVEGLMKLGSDRHGDELHYLYPAIEEKLVKEGADPAAAGKFVSFLKNMGAKASAGGKAVADKAKAGAGHVAEYHKGMARGAKAGVTGVNEHGQALSKMERAKALGVAGAKALPHAAVLGGLGYGLSRPKKEKKD
jgi:hypothetical protein